MSVTESPPPNPALDQSVPFVERVAMFERAKAGAKSRIDDELERYAARIAELEGQLQQRDQELAKLVEANNPDEDTLAVQQKQKDAEKNPRTIPAEEALDYITRLENVQKMEVRRIKLLKRENITQNKLLREKTKEVERLKSHMDSVVFTTGYYDGKTKAQSADVDSLRARVLEMEALEKTMIEEEHVAAVLVRKKQQLVDSLIEELDSKKTRAEELNALYNEIRVKNRDVQQKLAEIEELKREDKKTDGALVVAENRRDHIAISSLEGDKEFLISETNKQRELKRNQELVLELQYKRSKMLYARLDVITAALRDLKLEKQMEHAVSKSSLVATPPGEPDDKERIMPTNECVPAETYQLLVHDLEVVKNSVSRKDIITIEKEATLQAVQEKVEMALMKNVDEDRQRDVARALRAQRMEEMQANLSERLTDYRRQIDALLSGNLKLRNRIEALTRGK